MYKITKLVGSGGTPILLVNTYLDSIVPYYTTTLFGFLISKLENCSCFAIMNKISLTVTEKANIDPKSKLSILGKRFFGCLIVLAF